MHKQQQNTYFFCFYSQFGGRSDFLQKCIDGVAKIGPIFFERVPTVEKMRQLICTKNGVNLLKTAMDIFQKILYLYFLHYEKNEVLAISVKILFFLRFAKVKITLILLQY